MNMKTKAVVFISMLVLLFFTAACNQSGDVETGGDVTSAVEEVDVEEVAAEVAEEAAEEAAEVAVEAVEAAEVAEEAAEVAEEVAE
jgi:hypothetical protein